MTANRAVCPMKCCIVPAFPLIERRLESMWEIGARARCGTRFGTRFFRGSPASHQGNLGTDARFPSESRHVVVIC